MPKRSITSAQNKAINTGFLDLMGESQSSFEVPTFNALAESLAYVAAVYTEKLVKQLTTKDADSSGALADSILALDVQILGSVYSVEISANKYASFIDEGVDGWAVSHGSPYKFKSKGVNPRGEMVKSIKEWLVREGKISRIKNRAISARENRRAQITDTTTKAAISTAYMIKRQGIKPTYFWRDATDQMDEVIRKEFSAALRIDIIQNISKN